MLLFLGVYYLCMGVLWRHDRYLAASGFLGWLAITAIYALQLFLAAIAVGPPLNPPHTHGLCSHPTAHPPRSLARRSR